MRERVGELFPAHGLIGEEGAEAPDVEGDPDWVWVIDPVDGTTNFINGFPSSAPPSASSTAAGR